jgi:hypothetical protein
MKGLKAALISRLTCALGYSAYDLIRTSLPGEAGRKLLTGLVPFFACGAIFCKHIEGLQILFAILAAQGLASLMPIPHEPSVTVVIPNVMMYFAVFSIVRTQLLINDALSDQFMALSLNARALAYFKTSEQVTEAAVMSISYIVVMKLNVMGPKIEAAKTVVDCFATRSAALWIASLFEPDALLFFLLVINTLSITVSSDVTSIMELKCAQQLVGKTTEGEAMMVLLVILLFFTKRLGGVSTCGISMLATKRIEGLIKEWNHAEAAAVYMSVFCLLQMCKDGDKHDENRTSSSIVVIAHEDAEEFLHLLQS